jgi:hypothetical protein
MPSSLPNLEARFRAASTLVLHLRQQHYDNGETRPSSALARALIDLEGNYSVYFLLFYFFLLYKLY